MRLMIDGMITGRDDPPGPTIRLGDRYDSL
jgi:hypothetical protein